MRNFQDTFEIRKRSFIGAFSICMTVPLTIFANQEVNVCFSKKLAHFVKSVLRFSLLPYCQRNKPFIAVTLESIVCFKHNFTKNSVVNKQAHTRRNKPKVNISKHWPFLSYIGQIFDYN